MKAKSLFSIITRKTKTDTPSIKETVAFSWDILFALSSIDAIFSQPIYYHANKELHLKIAPELKEQFVNDVSKQVLNKEWNDITKFEGNKKPTVDYKRLKDGFSTWFRFELNGSKAFSISIGAGYEYDGILISSFDRNYQNDYSWYEQVLFKLIEIMMPVYATVIVNYQPINMIYNEFKFRFPPGWITFYSKPFLPSIPMDIAGISYQPLMDGLLIKTETGDFLADKETYEIYKQKLKLILTRFDDFSSSWKTLG